MNILDSIVGRRKQKAAQIGMAQLALSQVGASGVVLSIAEAIQGSGNIKTRRLLNSAFTKVALFTKNFMVAENRVTIDLNTEESGMLELIGSAIEKGTLGLLSSFGSVFFNLVNAAVFNVVIPLFTFFCRAIYGIGSFVIRGGSRLALANPGVAAALAALAGIGWVGWKMYRNYQKPEQLQPETQTQPQALGPSQLHMNVIQPNQPASVMDRVNAWRIKLGLDAKEEANGIPRGLLTALMAQESGGNANAVSKSNAQGLFQLIPSTAKELGVNPNNPEQAATGAAKYLGNLLKKYDGDIVKALTAYNAGPHALDRALQGLRKLARESLEYAPRVLGYHNLVSAAGDTSGKLMLPTSGVLTSSFGTRSLDGITAKHQGIDIANNEGTPILAAAAGKVTAVRPATGYGSIIEILHQGLTTLYGHTRKQFVAPGDTVAKGQVIAEMGNLGKSTGPHLHFEVKANFVAQDPALYLNLPSQREDVASAQAQTQRDVPNSPNYEYVALANRGLALRIS